MFTWLGQARSVFRLESRRHPRLTDLLVAIAAFGFGFIAPAQPATAAVGLTPAAVAIGAIGCTVLLARRRWPIGVLVVVTGQLVFALLFESPQPLAGALAVALYTVAVYRPREVAWGATICVGVVLGPVAAIDAEVILIKVFVGLWTYLVAATAIGDSVRNRRAYVAEIEERAVRAERTREQEARNRVTEERLRIARELHDVVAHHIALIRVQAGVATHVLPGQPTVAEEALGHISRASRTVLDELGALLNVLRDTSEPASKQPAPGLANLAELISAFGASGMTVQCSTHGRTRELPALADLAAYRIVQEALTNAHKYGDGDSTTVGVSYTTRELLLYIHNHVPDNLVPDHRTEAGSRSGPQRGEPEQTGGGHGIEGMRERAVALGGHLRAGPDPDGGFSVTARLPIPVDEPHGSGWRDHQDETCTSSASARRSEPQ